MDAHDLSIYTPSDICISVLMANQEESEELENEDLVYGRSFFE